MKHLTFELKEDISIHKPKFPPHSFAKIEFGHQFGISRAYSIVSGDLNKFCLGVALDDHSRGGSAYIHERLALGDQIRMAPGSSPRILENETKSGQHWVENRVVIIGGIGVTAFLPAIDQWESEGLPYDIHYAVRSSQDAAFVDRMLPKHLVLYAKSQKQRLNVDNVIPPPAADGRYTAMIYSCGPPRLMDAVRKRVASLGYPAHLLHFESFGVGGVGPMGVPFNVRVNDTDTGRTVDLVVSAEKSLLRTLMDAGFDMTYSCEVGGCGACKVALSAGKVCHNGTALSEKEKASYMLSCVDRGTTSIEIELD